MSEKIIEANPLNETETKICEMVEAEKDTLVNLLMDLIKIDSRSYSIERFSNMSKIFDFAEKFMNEVGYKTQMYKAPHLLKDENIGKKEWPNLIAYIEGDLAESKKQKKKTLQLNGHLDVVPFMENKWDEGTGPLKQMIKNGLVYGRGACDMKGGMASQMVACKIFKKLGIPFSGKLQLWCIPDEELDGIYGAQYMCKNHSEVVNADATIIAEPSGQPPVKSPAIVVGEKGHKWLKFNVYGASGHGSMPKPKSNAINKAVRFINKSNKWKLPKVKSPIGLWDLVKALFSRFSLGELIKALKSVGDEEPDPYMEDGLPIKHFFNTSVSFTMIEGGSKTNV